MNRYKARKLTAGDVRLIRHLIADREWHKRQARALSAKRLAEKFDVCQRTIERITANTAWKTNSN